MVTGDTKENIIAEASAHFKSRDQILVFQDGKEVPENHRITRKTAKVPDIAKIVLIVTDEKNRGEWKKGKVVRHIRGKDGVVRGLSLLHKGHHIDRPLNLVCPLEIRQAVASDKGVLNRAKPTA